MPSAPIWKPRCRSVLRYADMAETRLGVCRRPQYQIVTDELVAKDSGALMLYGFGLVVWAIIA